MLAWLNMGNIPPHLRAVIFKVAARGGDSKRPATEALLLGPGYKRRKFCQTGGQIPRVLAATGCQPLYMYIILAAVLISGQAGLAIYLGALSIYSGSRHPQSLGGLPPRQQAVPLFI